MEPPHSDYASDLLEQAHLAYTRKQYAEARMMLETLVTTHPDDQEASDLYARVVAVQAADARRGSQAWNRDIISKSAGQALIIGLGLLAFGIITSIPAFRAGFTQGFGPHATVIVDGKHVHSVPLYDVLFQSSLLVVVGMGMFAYCWWDIRKNKVGRNS